jgi:two-component system nitrogen regulation response regulator NtrX
MSRQPAILVVDDEANIRRMLGAVLATEGFKVTEAAGGAEALAAVQRRRPDAVLMDLAMPGGPDGMETLARLAQEAPGLPVIMMSGRAGLQDAVRATKLGAFHFLEKPLAPEAVLLALRSALALAQARAEAEQLREALGPTDTIVGGSPQIEELRALIARVAPTEARVLITGESGTGKELVAAAIHAASGRADGSFVRVNCAAIPRELVESEMFGHERGSFTGATVRRIGRFEQADGGTLFLDEVGDLAPEAQAKLLRALEAGEIERVGGERPIPVDVRVVSATNKDLARAVRDGTFREDLLYRLNVFPVAISPLRERPADIPELVRHFTELVCRRIGRPPATIAPDAMDLLVRHRWPGNVRELANIVERLIILSPRGEVSAEEARGSLPAAEGASGPLPSPVAAPLSLAEELDAYERTLITRALSAARGNMAEAARLLATDRANLYRRLRRLGIEAGERVQITQ